MMSLVVVIGLVAACTATPTFRYFDGPQYYGGGYFPGAAAVQVSPIKSQYHAQNEQGGYAYGYNDGYSSKSETKHPNGLTEGAYSYVDPNGVLQAYKYVSDENGYRVTGTNLPVAPAVPVAHAAPAVAVEAVPAAAAAPVYDAAEIPQPVQDTPEVAAAKVAHQVAYEQAAKAAEEAPADDSSSSGEPASVEAVEVSAAPAAVIKTAPAPLPASYSYGYPAAYGAYPSYASYASYAAPAPAPVASYAYAAPAPAYSYAAAAPAPVAGYAYAAAAPAYGYAPFAAGSYSPVHSQYHSQDEFGQYSYGYNSGSSSKAEVKTLDGVTRGGYSYVDANGIVQQYNYVSDPINGFRVAGTNLPSNSL